MVKETKFYDLLGVKPDIDEAGLKRAYRKKALALHPDKETDPKKKAEAEEKFKEVSRAYEVLSNAEMRAKYDRMGEKGIDESGGGGESPADLFASLFGGGRRPGERKPREIIHQLEVPLEDFYTGKTKKLKITRERLCGTCQGTGAKKQGVSAKCRVCDGRGFRIGIQQLAPGFVQQVQMMCPQCRGKGTALRDEDKCGVCQGNQVASESKVFEVAIEKGMKGGDHVAFVGEGDQHPEMRVAGDIIIVLKERPHPVFKRKGRLLIVEHTMDLADALCGYEFAIKHLDGRAVILKSSPGQVIRPDVVYVVHNEGMPVKGTGGCEKGELVVNVTIKFPTTLAPAQAAELRRVLGPMKPMGAVDTEDLYETTMNECTVPLQELAGRDDDDDDDERGGGGGGGGFPHGQRVQCAQS